MLAPLTELTGRKESKLEWNESYKKAFENKKSLLARDMMSAYPNFAI